jgi:hypothetical protein
MVEVCASPRAPLPVVIVSALKPRTDGFALLAFGAALRKVDDVGVRSGDPRLG